MAGWKLLLLPLAALLLVVTIGGGTLLLRDNGAKVRVPGDEGSPATTTSAGLPHLKPEASVCQGILHRPAPGEPRTFPAMYTKRAEAKGIIIVGDANVDDDALRAAQQTIEKMFAHNDLAADLAAEGAYVVIADAKQGVLDLPEFACLGEQTGSDFFTHVCGVADRADYPVVTVSELDLIGNENGPCHGLNVLYHELGHLVQGWTLAPADYFDVKIAYQAALDAGKYRREYANTNPNEYFAEATQAYFLHSDVNGAHDRAWLQKYDPDIYKLLEQIYGG